MSSPPSRGLYRAQSRLLQEIKHFDRGELRPCPTRVVTLLGETIESLAKLRAREGAQQVGPLSGFLLLCSLSSAHVGPSPRDAALTNYRMRAVSTAMCPGRP